jgi:hypothetical protein
MKVGDYVKMNDNSGYAYIQGFMTWKDEVGEYDMVELLMDDGCTVETASDEYQVVNEDDQ